MELAQAMQLLWRRKIWLAVGVVVALAVGAGSIQLLKNAQEYATAMTQMIVDSPRSPLGNTGASLDPFTARASVFADLMASHPALVAIGEAAGIPPDQIVASAPADTTGTTTVSPTPPRGSPADHRVQALPRRGPDAANGRHLRRGTQRPSRRRHSPTALSPVSRAISVAPEPDIDQQQPARRDPAAWPTGQRRRRSAREQKIAAVGAAGPARWCGMILLFERKRANKAQAQAANTATVTVRGSMMTRPTACRLRDGALTPSPTFRWNRQEWRAPRHADKAQPHDGP